MNEQGFTYHIYRPGDSHQPSENKGLTSCAVFLNEFEQYPWRHEADTGQPGTDATLSVRQSSQHLELFVSVVGSPADFSYLVGLAEGLDSAAFTTCCREISPMWGTVYIVDQPDAVKALFALFFNGEIAALNKSLRRFPVLLEPQVLTTHA